MRNAPLVPNSKNDKSEQKKLTNQGITEPPPSGWEIWSFSCTIRIFANNPFSAPISAGYLVS